MEGNHEHHHAGSIDPTIMITEGSTGRTSTITRLMKKRRTSTVINSSPPL